MRRYRPVRFGLALWAIAPVAAHIKRGDNAFIGNTEIQKGFSMVRASSSSLFVTRGCLPGREAPSLRHVLKNPGRGSQQSVLDFDYEPVSVGSFPEQNCDGDGLRRLPSAVAGIDHGLGAANLCCVAA
jgi:hypothetical protein